MNRSIVMVNSLYLHLKQMEKLCLGQQMDPNIYSCQLSRALVILSICVVESDSFKYNFEIYNSGKISNFPDNLVADNPLEQSSSAKNVKLIALFFEFLTNIEKFSVSLSEKNFIYLEMTILYFLNSIMLHALGNIEVRLFL